MTVNVIINSSISLAPSPTSHDSCVCVKLTNWYFPTLQNTNSHCNQCAWPQRKLRQKLRYASLCLEGAQCNTLLPLMLNPSSSCSNSCQSSWWAVYLEMAFSPRLREPACANPAQALKKPSVKLPGVQLWRCSATSQLHCFFLFFPLSFSFLLAGFVSHTFVQLSFKGTTGRFTHQVHKQGRTI